MTPRLIRETMIGMSTQPATRYKFGDRIRAAMPVSSARTGIVANLPDEVREFIVLNDAPKGNASPKGTFDDEFVMCSPIEDGFQGRTYVPRNRIVGQP